jgi:flavin-dependent dehydrogenase
MPETPEPRLNRPPAELPAQCEVLVVGAGPAGTAAAATLAAAGFDVLLVDQQAFPRDKVCGDGLIPDAHHALARLGLLDAVMAAAARVSHVACIAPRGGRVEVPGSLAVLPRRTLDLMLCRHAAEAGARMHAPLRFVGLIEQGGVVVGARLQHAAQGLAPGRPEGTQAPHGAADTPPAGTSLHAVRARWVVLATGAVPQGLIAAGLCERRTPSGVALRGYLHNPAWADRLTQLEVVWHRRLGPGYGWIFPCPGGVFNIGVGLSNSHAARANGRHAMEDVNLRKVFEAFIEVHATARELVATGRWEGELKGAPLRCSLEGARFSRAGLLVAGEAAGSTYAFTGEGIGKALETGLLAAQALIDGRRDALDEASVRARYEASLRALKPRFAVYEKASRINAAPWLLDLVVWSATRSPRRLQRMAGVLDETHLPSNMLTLRGVLRAALLR